MNAIAISGSRMYRTRGSIVDSVSVRFPYNDALRVAFRREFSQTFWDPGCQSAFKFGSDAILVQLLFRAD